MKKIEFVEEKAEGFLRVRMIGKVVVDNERGTQY